MLYVAPGEQNPRVALVQILLNRAGADLVVDGICGPKTRAAAAAFQKSNGIRDPDAILGPITWGELPTGNNTEVVDVVDVGDPSLEGSAAAQVRRAGGDPITLGLMCGGVEQMVALVMTKAKRGTIALLRITGHGNLGQWMTVSVGNVAHLPKEDPKEYALRAAEYHSYIDWAHIDELAPTLAKLKDFFAPYGQMEHHGCSLGSRAVTRQLMHTLADLWEVPVSVGVGLQNSAVQLRGQIFTAYPDNGSLKSWTTPFRTACV